MTSNAWTQKTCIVGLGQHALLKLIPALQAGGQQIVAVVTSQEIVAIPGAVRFAKLEDAVAGLPRDIVFVIASPPAAHYAQAKTILASGHDVFLEKPAFVTTAELDEVAALCARNDAVLLEGFMYRYTQTHARLLDYWQAHRSDIIALRCNFLIPDKRPGTFRDGLDVGSSILFDIGCYPISLLFDLGLDHAQMRVVEGTGLGIPDRENLGIEGLAGQVRIRFQIGMGTPYENWAELVRRNGEAIRIQPFFYGRPGDKNVTIGLDTETITDASGFEGMFALTRDALRADQPARHAAMRGTTAILEELGQDLVRLRGLTRAE
jgi:hypothetical protein